MSKEVDLRVKEMPTVFGQQISGSLDAGLDDIRITQIAGLDNIKISLGGIQDRPVVVNSTLNSTSTLTSTSTLNSTNQLGGIPERPIVVDLGLDDIRINNLPTMRFAMEPTRVHFPVHLRFGLSALGIELMAFSICGESMVVIEKYEARAAEKCG